jgi:Spy/CpxP family protein refolding chaperone
MRKYGITLISLAGIFWVVFISNVGWAARGNQERQQGGRPSGLPPEIVAACQGKSEQAACQVGGIFTGTCHTLQNQRACVLSQDEASADLKQQWDSLDRNHDGFLDVNEVRGDAGSRGNTPGDNREQGSRHNESNRPEGRKGQSERQGGQGRGYSIDQAISDRAQLTTIAFAALAYLTGDLCGDTFLPPGKVSDFFGFQYLRDTDSGEMGHNTTFVPRSANNMLHILNDGQKAKLITLAKEQVTQINEFGYTRFPLMKAFRRQLEGDIPLGSKGLDKQAVMEYSAELYRLDGKLSFQRAQVLGSIIRSLDQEQRAYLDKMASGNSLSWQDLPDQVDKRSYSHEEHVAVMTYASEMFSWYAGSVEADTYFCPERHGMYFGAFYMKDIPAMGNPNYSISTQITGDSGDAFLNVLNETQRDLITSLVNVQHEALNEIVATRRAISEQLRQFMQKESVDEDAVLALSKKYGELDGEISYYYATHFAEVYKTLSSTQKKQLMELRNLDDFSCSGAYLYSRNIAMPNIKNTDFLF